MEVGALRGQLDSLLEHLDGVLEVGLRHAQAAHEENNVGVLRGQTARVARDAELARARVRGSRNASELPACLAQMNEGARAGGPGATAESRGFGLPPFGPVPDQPGAD